MESAWNNAVALMPRLVDMGFNLVVAIAILVIGWWVSALLGKWVHHVAEHSGRVDRTVIPMFKTTVAWAIRVFTLIAVLARFGVQTASLIAVLGAAGLAVGLALQGTLQNIAAGIMLLLLRPIRAGEAIALSSGASGTVDEIGLFITRIEQFDGIVVLLPNSTVWTATITNYSRNTQRRLDLPVIVNYGDDLDAAIALVNKVVGAHPMTEADPAPIVKVNDYKDTGTEINVRVWSKASDYWDLRWDLFHQIRVVMAREGFRPPAQGRDLRKAMPRA
ncbi:mechanosensitive ion channel family protein [Bordetella sp. FB-8]|uniref:mechanosensitive ion channel family protein n=1 Tax=Bordetella sp. FB-8 TaxID=1159870 RepID=UPI000376A62F|nr:mechanosensitive ion channel domain-containing protein [Bordetella sp. FB-8]